MQLTIQTYATRSLHLLDIIRYPSSVLIRILYLELIIHHTNNPSCKPITSSSRATSQYDSSPRSQQQPKIKHSTSSPNINSIMTRTEISAG